MAIYPIRTFGDPVLRTRAVDVSADDDSLGRLVEDMLETMYEAPGVGLAAPQIGIPKRIFVADIGEGPFVMVNPEIVEASGTWTFDEGCLSVPGYYWPIKRPSYTKARGLDIHGEPVEFEGDELMGRVLQHEIDHLNGMLLIERLSRKDRRQALREIREDSLRSTGLQ
ncbi:MAG: peptide deformylase [Acidimicrobiia bacterium]|nr:peptide deformylase [Acidimicrobiia bacterium]